MTGEGLGGRAGRRVLRQARLVLGLFPCDASGWSMSAGNEQYRVRVLFDETHSESWSISKEKARQISPQYPEYSSYAAAADLLSQREFSTRRNLDQPLIASTLKSADLLALIHPCDPRWNAPFLEPRPDSCRKRFEISKASWKAGVDCSS